MSNIIPTPQTFFRDAPLYETFVFDFETEMTDANRILFYEGSIDCYCPKCKTESVFLSIDNRPRDFQGMYAAFRANEETDMGIQKAFRCSRNGDHLIYFYMTIQGSKITKSGQMPSHADLTVSRLDGFKKVISPEILNELKKAFGLISHGVGVGSFVYLRRVIERFIVEPAHQTAKASGDWDEVSYQNSRFGEKIARLRDRLPEFLVNNKAVYGVISKGIHELSENECKEFFPVVSEIILHVLTDMKADRDKQLARLEMEKALNKITAKLA